MKKPRKVLIATDKDDFRFPDPDAADAAGIEFEYAPQRAIGALNGRALELSALVLEIDVRDDQALRQFETLAGAPGCSIIAATRNADSADVRRLFRAGAADVLTTPFTAEALLNSLADLLAPTAAGPPSHGGCVISVIKAAGGAGATTLALNLARLLSAGPARKTGAGRSAAVLDLDLQFGDTDIGLDLEPRSTILDIIKAPGRFDARFLQSVLTDHSSGLRLLAPPRTLLPLDALSAPLAIDLIDAASNAHQVTVIDLPGSWADWTLPVLKRSDLIVLVAPSSVAGVAGARRVLDALEQGGVVTPVFFVVSKLAGLADVLDKPARIARTLEQMVDAGLAFDGQAAKAADRGRLVVDAFPNTRLSKELRSATAKIEQKLASHLQPLAHPLGALP